MNLIGLLHKAERPENLSSGEIDRLIAQLEKARNPLHSTDLTVEANIQNLHTALQERRRTNEQNG